MSGEFWLGNENIHSLTSRGDNVLRIDMEAFDGETRFAVYTGFSIDNESTYYTLRLEKMVAPSNAGKCDCMVAQCYLSQAIKQGDILIIITR